MLLKMNKEKRQGKAKRKKRRNAGGGMEWIDMNWHMLVCVLAWVPDWVWYRVSKHRGGFWGGGRRDRDRGW